MQTSIGSTLHACCNHCCFDLRWAQASTATANELLAGAWVNHALQFGWARIGESVVYAPAFFAGISAFVLALHGKFKWQGLDMSPLEQRRELISRACSLLPDWPTQFLEQCAFRNWTAVDLTVSRKQLPYWLHHLVKQNLDQSRVPISTNEARAIYEQTVITTGRFSLKTARVISGRMIEQKHLAAMYRVEVRDDSFELLLAHIDHLISQELKLEHRYHLFADKVMLALARVCGLTQVDIANYALSDAMKFASHDRPDFWCVPTTIESVTAWMGWYLRDVRPLLDLPKSVSHAFVCRQNNRPLSASAIGERFRKYVGDACLQREITDFSSFSRRARVTTNDICE